MALLVGCVQIIFAVDMKTTERTPLHLLIGGLAFVSTIAVVLFFSMKNELQNMETQQKEAIEVFKDQIKSANPKSQDKEPKQQPQKPPEAAAAADVTPAAPVTIRQGPGDYDAPPVPSYPTGPHGPGNM